MTFRITYSMLDADLSALHAQFDQTLSSVRARLGAEYPSWIAGTAYRSGDLLESRNPANPHELLGRFHRTPASEVDRVVRVAREAQRAWGATPWGERVRILRRAATLITERRMELAARMTLEVGKNRLESLGDVEEAADLLRYYAGQLEEAQGFVKPMARLSPNEDTRNVLRPYGVFAVIAPFNFPVALAAGMSAGALLGGNAVILKPSEETPWCAEGLYHAFADAGLPPGVFQVVHGEGESLGAALVRHPALDGVTFTGSKAVGMSIHQQLSTGRARPCLLELGGKNPAIICRDADLEMAVEGCYRSAFGLSGQKCSALSRIYVHESLQQEFITRLAEKARGVTVGDPSLASVYMGPVINKASVQRFERAAAAARSDGTVHAGGERLRLEGALAEGYFVAPTVVELAHGHRLMREELFLPFVGVTGFDTLEEALVLANDGEYGLTAGIFSRKPSDVEAFMDRVEAGVLYANRRTGATTGAWPGVQSFCGWKSSGSTGKGGCGPYYVAQFMREQSQTRMG
ncbi:L-glutamate gamma-semialdehyde dehydrogenase [Stigmatella aurantiaca]|uniref:L-glutamate gamma-semialdehyde dehydrogenase n=1 Tax=Stigmatella aurantiaca (strain DW4/3-1) TaxID=378806 RepID=Q09DC3_STIAD|nr:L-glutamate gamma-semialdehyde dehydrogenase [Stigmatella aurantiaca]ADO69390.1 Aldehyde dehydrogenase [Stigmatella aurantiaca DW4/3-1]EAU69730.1 1-pyrroline-5-carboxylate dehydrogenase 1 [Stigmatella aurantiaca DW4/3-1]